jgi:DNA-binding MarR family transcriptional regulator
MLSIKDLEKVILSKICETEGLTVTQLVNTVFESMDERSRPDKKTITRHIKKLEDRNFLRRMHHFLAFSTSEGCKLLAGVAEQ